MIQLTERARGYLRRHLEGGTRYLRVTVVPGGCSGMTYHAAVVGELGDDEEVVYEDGGIRISSDAFSKYFLHGLEIDYSDDLIKPGLTLTNRLATQACGCGASFAV
ncbi:MAG: iron-sulfur cluster assembly accessory protein [bacterium]|nr:iron-sulfur cluster assembly accessory protein [bacterium]